MHFERIKQEELAREASSLETSSARLWEIFGRVPSRDRVTLWLPAILDDEEEMSKALTVLFGVGYQKAKELVKSAPCLMKEEATLEEALKLHRLLESKEPPFQLDGLCFVSSPFVLCALAQNPAAPKELLRWLAFSEEREVIQALVQNPSVPLEILWIISTDHPKEFLQNPIWSMLLLEDPTLSQVPDFFWAVMAWKLEEIPPWILSVVLQSRNGRMALAGRAGTLSKGVISSLLSYEDTHLKRTLAAHVKEESVLERLLLEEPSVLTFAASNKAASANMLERFSTDSSVEVRLAVAKNQSAPPEVIALLLTDPDLQVRNQARKHPNAPGAGIYSALG